MTKKPEDRYEFKNGIHFFDMTNCLSDEEYMGFGIGIIDFFHMTICPEKSKTAIRRDLTQGACKLNDVPIINEKARVSMDRQVFNDRVAWMIIYRD